MRQRFYVALVAAIFMFVHWQPTTATATMTGVTLVSVSGAAALSTPSVPVIPAVNDFTALSAGHGHTCVVSAGGSVKCWGWNAFGQLGDGTTTDRWTAVDVTNLTSAVKAVAASMYHTCALTTDGGVLCWGQNNVGQLGDGTTTDRHTPTPVLGLASGVSAITTRGGHTCALTSDGGVKCWGWNGYGQLGDGSTNTRLTPVDVQGLTVNVTAISAGVLHTCAVTTGGAAKCWGNNLYGQLGDRSTTAQAMPVDVFGLETGIASLTANQNHTCALTTAGGVKCWGDNLTGQLGDGTSTLRTEPVDVVGLPGRVQTVEAGSAGTCALTSAGSVRCWGYVYSSQRGNGLTTIWPPTVEVSGLGDGVRIVSVGSWHSCALLQNGSLRCWGNNTYGQLGNGAPDISTVPLDPEGLTAGVEAVATGFTSTCVLTMSGAVKCFGSNLALESGFDSPNIPYQWSPVDVSGLGESNRAISARFMHGCALTAAKGIKCWGNNASGQLGNGSWGSALAGDVVGLTSGVSMVAAGWSHTCALSNFGGVKCWGNNGMGQVGDGSLIGRLTPVDVSGLRSGVRTISAGAAHSCAVIDLGGVRCWGGNSSGQLGDGTTTNRVIPTPVNGLVDPVKEITAGSAHTCILTVHGAVQCWGQNTYGQLGDGTTMDRISPVMVVGLDRGVKSISAGGTGTCAVTDTGTAKCWGANNIGQIGDGTFLYRFQPTDVFGLSDGVRSVSVGGGHACAVLESGGVKCWGSNYAGQLGVAPPASPVDVVWPYDGIITDTANRPLPGVLVTAVDPFGIQQSTYTDAEGKFAFVGRASGIYTISVAKPMYTFSPSSTQIVVPENQSGPTFLGTLSPSFSPVVFLPGIGGSALREAGSPDDLWPGQAWGTDHSRLSNQPGQRRDIYTPDVLRRVVLSGPLPDQNIYAEFIDVLLESFREYDAAGTPARRTTAGCDLTQAPNNPDLFVFPYDWRLSNVGAAEQLRDYIGCIQRFYPGAKMSLVAHSMGGLVARRYILLPGAGQSVRRLITVGTPWLGAPKFLDVLETGNFGLTNVLLFPDEVRALLEYYPGAHELLPSEVFMQFAQVSGEPPVVREEGWDINQQGGAYESYGYEALLALTNRRYPIGQSCNGESACRVGQNNTDFHGAPGQDLWAGAPADIDYHYLMGVRRTPGTIAGFVAAPVPECLDVACTQVVTVNRLLPVTGAGDGTVPLVSARRAPLSQNPDGANITLHRVAPSSFWDDKDDSDTEHGGMLHNPAVLQCIMALLLGSAPCPAVVQRSALQRDETAAGTEAAGTVHLSPAYHVSVFGSRSAYTTNAEGQVTGAISQTRTVRGAGEVTYAPSSTGNFLFIIPTTDIYTVTFQSESMPLRIEVVRKADDSPDYAARWRDILVPPSVMLSLHLSPAGVEQLLYDASGDGIPDTEVPAAPLVVRGTAAADEAPPSIELRMAPDRTVTILADDASGMGALYYSFDGAAFTRYTSPVNPPLTAHQVYVFADDNAGNRAPVVIEPLVAVRAPAISSSPVTVAGAGERYTYQVLTTGTPMPTVTLLSGPSGMTIDAHGLVEWLPTTAGNFLVVVEAANGVGAPALQSFQIEVRPSYSPAPGKAYLPLLQR